MLGEFNNRLPIINKLAMSYQIHLAIRVRRFVVLRIDCLAYRMNLPDINDWWTTEKYLIKYFLWTDRTDDVTRSDSLCD